MKGFYNALELMKFGDNLVMKKRSFRDLNKNEILVKVHRSPISPADIMFMKGQYGDKIPEIFPVIPGLEGSGEVIAVGSDLKSTLIGKRVSILGNPNTNLAYDGLWAEFHYTTLDHVIIYDQVLPYDKICCLINPITALGLIDTFRKSKNDSVLITGAAGSVGKTFIKLCQRESINFICLVKNEDQQSKLKAIGAQNILRLNDSDCFMELKKLCVQLKTQICYDCLGGEYSSKLLHCMPSNSTLYHFGNLEEKELSKILSSDLIFHGKSIKGWWVNRWRESLTKEEREYWMGYIKSEFQTKSDLFNFEIHETYDLEEVDIAMQDYYSDIFKGKIIINPYNENVYY